MKFRELAFQETNIEIIDGDRGKNYPKKHELKNCGHTLFLNNKNIINNFLDDSFGEYITKEKSDLLRKGKLEREDLVMSTRGSVGNIGYYSSKIETENIRINSGMVIIRNKDDNIDTEYLYVLLTSNLMKKRILEKISGSVQNQLPIRDLKKIKLPIPDLKSQQKIKNFILNFDKKIEINNKIIENLEAQAQAIFKSWFVDFEPFADGDFVESDLGLIPKGWEVKSIKEFSKEIITGKTPSTKIKEYYGDKIPFITIPDMHDNIYIIDSERYLSEKGEESQKNKTLPPNTICISCIATVGLVSLTSEFSQTNQQINSVIAKKDYYTYYLYLTLKNMYKYLGALGSSGSTTKNINKKTFESINILFPEEKIIKEFNLLCKNNFDLIKSNQIENKKLEEIRDTLLPKLMAGEIDISNISIED